MISSEGFPTGSGLRPNEITGKQFMTFLRTKCRRYPPSATSRGAIGGGNESHHSAAGGVIPQIYSGINALALSGSSIS
jgi:hypothetical protein